MTLLHAITLQGNLVLYYTYPYANGDRNPYPCWSSGSAEGKQSGPYTLVLQASDSVTHMISRLPVNQLVYHHS